MLDSLLFSLLNWFISFYFAAISRCFCSLFFLRLPLSTVMYASIEGAGLLRWYQKPFSLATSSVGGPLLVSSNLPQVLETLGFMYFWLLVSLFVYCFVFLVCLKFAITIY